MLVAYYSNGSAHPTSKPIGTLTTRDRYALVSGTPPVGTCIRMLEPHEIAAGMAFAPGYQVKGPSGTRSAGTATPSPHPPPKSSFPPS